MKTTTRTGLLLLCCFSLSAACCMAEGAEKLKIGAILPLSGPSASLGRYVHGGIQLAYRQLPEPERIELYIEDDGWSIPRSISAYQKLVETRHVNALIVVGSAVGHALAPLAEQKKIPLISIGASDHRVVQGRRYAFLHWVTPEAEAKELADEIVRRHYQKIAFVTAEQEGWLAVYRAIRNELTTRGMAARIVLDETYLPEERDYRSYLSKARSKKADVIVVGLFPGAVAAFAKQLRRAGMKADIAGLETFEDAAEVQAAEGALLGVWYVNAASARPGFEAQYKAVLGSDAGWASANAFDAVMLLAEAYRQEGRSPEAISSFLSSLKDYRGAAGLYSASGDNRFTLPATIKIISKDGFEELHRELH